MQRMMAIMVTPHTLACNPMNLEISALKVMGSMVEYILTRKLPYGLSDTESSTISGP